MVIFKTVSLKWWQTGLVKLTSVCLGVAIGANWSEVFAPYTVTLLVIAVVAGVYLLVKVWAKQ